MTDVLSPIFIRVGRRFLNPNGKPSVLRHVSIRNVRAESRSILPSIVAGLADSPVEYVRLSNIHVTVPIGVKADFFKTFPSPVPENEKSYPENRLTFGPKLPAGAFYFRHVNGLAVDDVSVTFLEKDARPAVYADDCRAVTLRNVRVDGQRLDTNPARLGQTGSEGIVVVP